MSEWMRGFILGFFSFAFGSLLARLF